MSRFRDSRFCKYYSYIKEFHSGRSINSYYITGGYGDRGGGNDGMVTQEDTIFVSGMDPSISEEEICQHFGAIGIIKVSLLNRIVKQKQKDSTSCVSNCKCF